MGTNTGLGIGIGIPFKNNALGGDKPYFPPELKARLIGVWDNYGKKNTDADRNIIKNKIPNAGGDLEILNAAYEGMSGYNGYPVIFGINKTWKKVPTYNSIYNINDNKIHITKVLGANRGLIFSYVKQNDQLYDITEIPSFKIRVSGLKGDSKVRYSYIKTENAVYQTLLDLDNGIHELPKSLAPTNSISNNSWIGFVITPMIEGELVFDCDITIEILPEYEGAFVTDGVNDMIISQKTLQEMGVTKDFTIVSMIHQISWRGTSSVPLTNYIRPTNNIYARNQIANIGKTGIYGYVVYDIKNSTVGNSHIINTILGDKNDYSIHITGNLSQGKFSVQGYINGEDNVVETSRVAHYWTFALLGKATEDDINLIIGYFNLDRTLKADIYCNIKKQGLTNENHAEFGDKLIDYSGNGRDIQLNNISWNKESGINDDGALCLDGVTDYGKAVGLPIYKDYTFIIDREILSIDNIGIIASKSESAEDVSKHGAFIFEYLTAPNVINTWSYYKNNTNIANTDFIRGISYQSKYNYNGKDLIIGTSEDSDKLYLGTIRDNSDKYGNIAIYFLMSFSYSMNKFLIERQLKKYKAGTLYKDMVEFRPVIKSNIDIKNIVYLDKDSNVVKVGDYISIGSNIKTSITVLDGYKISKVSSTAFNNITIEKSNTDFIYDVIFYGIKKSPQKINLVIEQDSDYVQWNPNIKANVSKYSVTANIRETDGTTLKLVNGQFYSTSITGNLILDIVPPYKDSDEVTNVVIDGKSYVPTKDSSGNYYRLEIPLVFPKEINITIQEYVRYEDIVQPYPVLLRFKDENNNEISWGDKIKLGSSITRIGSFNDCNLLKDIYTVSNAKLNGSPLPNTPHVVERQMVFTCTATWIFDDNEPKCILSPRLLRVPNSSYKILGHIPDISGHGNHGVIYNSAYKLNSGANGYLVDFTTFRDYGTKGIVRTDSKIYLDESFDYDKGFWLGYTNSPSPTYKVRVSGIPKDGVLNYTGESWINLINGINELPARTNTEEIHGFVALTSNVDWSKLVIEQIGEYEGAYCLDGINDFVTIPILSKGGKQVLMKVNWQKQDTMLYNQNPGQDNFAIFTNDYNNNNLVVAYASRNNGNTYIDGVINNNILATQLKGITHNIVATNNNIDATITPIIGSNKNHDNFFSQMSLYDFMLFDEISTDDKIKELNEYVGIEAKVELPPYYWDTYGKTNFDADRDTIQQRGIAVGDYDLTNYNHAYNKISGYGGYSFKSFNDSQDWNIKADGTGVEIVSRDGYSITIKKLIQNLDWQISNNEYKYPTILDKELPFKCVSNKKVGLIWQLKYKTEGATSDTNVTLINQQLTPNVPLEINLPYKTQDELTELGAVSTSIYYLLYFSNTTLEIGEEYTVEMLPLYPNGLLYDAVTDYSENVNIPVFTDFTAIMKRKWLKNQGCPLIKGSKVYEGGNGNALLFEWDKAYNFVFYKRTDIMEGEVPDNISFITPTNYNGNVITRGSEQDTNGICIAGDGNAGFANMIFYKLILYPKTVPLLQINFLKNLMEKDEIIDLTNPIFIKDE